MLRRLPTFAAVAFLSFSPLACGNSSPVQSPDQLAMRDKAAVERVLQSGTWKLTSWRPDTELEAMFQSLLMQQLATMTVHFQNGHLLADSPTVHIDRVYAVSDAAGPQFTLVTTDENGVQLKTNAQMSDDGNTIDFRGETSPWRGYGQIRRVQ